MAIDVNKGVMSALSSSTEATDAEQPEVPQEPDRLYVRWFWLFIGFAVAFGFGIAVAELVQARGGWDRGLAWERALLTQVHAYKLPKALDTFFLLIPWLGTNWTLAPFVAVPAFWLWRKLGRRTLALHLVTVLVGSSALNFLLKFMYDRPRPDLWEQRGQFMYASYPSGHAIASVAVLITVAMLLQRFKGWRWPWFVAVLILAFSLYSRLYLGVHWPTDVVAGYVMGTLWLGGTLVAFTERRWQGARETEATGS
jgi:undecaprenyl-diphosphatase